MITFLFSVVVSQLILEAAVTYLVFKNRKRIKYWIHEQLGINYIVQKLVTETQEGRCQVFKLEELVHSNHKILKRIRRDQRGVLKSAKKVDKFKKVKECIAIKDTIGAVKEYRNITGSSLKDAIETIRYVQNGRATLE